MAGLSKLVWILALARLTLHLVFSTLGYGFFGDELYYIACTKHLDFGYVDHPPLSIWVLAGWQAVAGESLAALRVLPGLLAGTAVLLSGQLARELGGRAGAQGLSALVVALAPIVSVVFGFYSMNAIDIIIWLLAFVLIARALREEGPGNWIALGVVLGLGLLNKISILWLGLGLFAALIATPHRRALRTPWPWLAGGLAALIFLPYVLWQVAQGWPTAEFMAMARTQKMLAVSPMELLAQQILVWNPLAFPLWAAGGVALLRRPPSDVGRVFAIIFGVTAAILIASGTSRPNYLALAMPPLIAAGAVSLERISQRPRLSWLLPTAGGSIALVGLALLPLGLPILTAPDLIAYSEKLHFKAPRMEKREIGALDAHFADMMGWEAIVDAVAEAYSSLPPEERARAAILAPSYSVAGAIDRFGPERGLPRAISGHNSYWLWGPGDSDGDLVIIAGGTRDDWEPYWESLDILGVWDCGYCLPGRNHANVYLARELREPLADVWPAVRRYR